MTDHRRPPVASFTALPLVAPVAGPARPRWDPPPTNNDLLRRAERAEKMLSQAEAKLSDVTRKASTTAGETANLVADVRAYKSLVDLLLDAVLSARVSHLESPMGAQRMVLGALLSGHLEAVEVAGVLPGAFDDVADRVAFVAARAMVMRGETMADDLALDRVAVAMGGAGATKEQVTSFRERLGEFCGFYLETEKDAVAAGQCGEGDNRTPRLLRELHREAWIDAFVGALIQVGAKRYCYETIGELRDGVAELRTMTTALATKASRVLEVNRAIHRSSDD